LQYLRPHLRLMLALVAIAIAAAATQRLHGRLRYERCVMLPARIAGPFVGGQSIPYRPPLAAQLAAWRGQHDNRKEFALLGFRWRRVPMISWPMQMGRVQKVGESYQFEISPWSLAIAAVLVAFLSLRKRTVFRPGTCASCGYDLRATPALCPECGAIPARAV
jgi:hypothetical protein